MIDREGAVSLTSDRRLAARWLDRDGTARLIIDRELKILWQNVSAGPILSSGFAVSVKNGRISFADTLGDGHWRTTLSSIGGKYRRFVVQDVRGNSNAVIGAFSCEPLSAICLTIVPISSSYDLSSSGLVERFQLTSAETRVAQLLVDLMSPKEAAEELGVSINTVRTHIRRLYSKAAVRSQPELLRLAMSYCIA